MTFNRIGGLVLGAVLLMAGSARAQVAWEAPLLVPPQAGQEFQLALIDVAGGDVGLMGAWRGAHGAEFRFGFAEGPNIPWEDGSNLSFFGGANMVGTLTRANADVPMDISWVIGGGAGIGHYTLVTLTGGVTVGRTLDAEGMKITPYVMPRLALDQTVGFEFQGEDLDESNLGFAAELGVDLAFPAGWLVRFGATLADDREALALGIVF